MTMYPSKIGFINKDGYITDEKGVCVIDHKGKKILVPSAYRKYYDKAICK